MQASLIYFKINVSTYDALLDIFLLEPRDDLFFAIRNQELTCRMDVVLARHMMDRSRLTAVCVTSARMHGSLKSQD